VPAAAGRGCGVQRGAAAPLLLSGEFPPRSAQWFRVCRAAGGRYGPDGRRIDEHLAIGRAWAFQQRSASQHLWTAGRRGPALTRHPRLAGLRCNGGHPRAVGLWSVLRSVAVEPQRPVAEPGGFGPLRRRAPSARAMGRWHPDARPVHPAVRPVSAGFRSGAARLARGPAPRGGDGDASHPR